MEERAADNRLFGAVKPDTHYPCSRPVHSCHRNVLEKSLKSKVSSEWILWLHLLRVRKLSLEQVGERG